MKISLTKKLSIALVFSFLFTCTLVGCDFRLSNKKLSGVYVTKLKYGKGILKLYPSGKCTLDFTYRKSNRKVKKTGRWKSEEEDTFPLRETNVLLYGVFTIGSNLGPPYYGLRDTDIWETSGYRHGNTIRLGYGLDLRHYFQKVKNIDKEQLSR